jgi:hypothetical protein
MSGDDVRRAFFVAKRRKNNGDFAWNSNIFLTSVYQIRF